MPPDTVFVVGRDGGDRAECVARFARLLAGDCVSQAEQLWRAGALAHRGEFKGKNLACWCALDEPCHADALLHFASDE